MSENVIEIPKTQDPPPEPSTEKESPQDWIKLVTSSPAFIPGVFLAIALAAVFWPLFAHLPQLWFGDDGYYSHGVLIPLISGYIVYRKWPRLKDIPVKPFYPALIPLVGLLWVATAAVVSDVKFFASIAFIGTLLCGIWFVAGGRWTWKLTIPSLYLAFGLPMWIVIINAYTNPLQQKSTDVSYYMLKLLKIGPSRGVGADITTIYLPNFNLDVGVPCSGMKLVIAMAAFTVFFIVIGGMRWWSNLIMVALVLPLCVLMNSLRITMIGLVGNQWGETAGHQFHDYSGYLTLIICFFLLFKIARLLGWKD